MSFDPTFVIKVFAALFAIMNPFANVPVFLSLTEGAAPTAQRAVAVTAAIGTAIGCVVSVLAGGAVLSLFGIGVNDFKLAGGVLVLLIALSMVQGSASHAHAATASEKADRDLDPAGVAIYPLTVPLLVGPGTIATLIVFGETARAQGRMVELAMGLGGFLMLLTLCLLAAPTLGRFLSPNANAIARRLMGMILAAVAMEMMVSGLGAVFPGLLKG